MKLPAFLRNAFQRREKRALGGRVRGRARERGMAMVLVLGALAILTVMLTEAQDENSAEFSAALAARDQLAAEYAAKSAVNLSRLLIAAEPTIRLQLTPLLMMLGSAQPPQLPVWNYADQVLGAFNDTTGKEAFAALSGLDLSQGEHLGMEGAGFEVVIIDEDSKINVNQGSREMFSKQRLMQQLMMAMAGAQYDPLFSNRDADGQYSDRQAICSAVIDWTDSDQDVWPCDGSDTAQVAAPEDSFYERLDKPYTRKNAPFDSLLELRRVRGMSEDFWANFVEPDGENPRKRLMTVWGQDKINVNTADPRVLLALICSQTVDPTQTKMCDGGEGSAKFLMMLNMLQSFTMGAPLFGNPKVFIQTLKGKGPFGAMLTLPEVGFEPPALKSESELEKQIGTDSKIFSIYAKGHVRSGKRETLSHIHAVVDFRSAPPPGQARTIEEAERQAAQITDATQRAAAEEKIEAALKPSPAGNIVYYRLD